MAEEVKLMNGDEFLQRGGESPPTVCWGEGSDPSPTIKADLEAFKARLIADANTPMWGQSNVRQLPPGPAKYPDPDKTYIPQFSPFPPGMPRYQERREVFISVTEETVFRLIILGTKNLPQYLVKTFHDRVPEDAVVERVWHAPLDRSFHFVLSHPSFDVVPEGMPCPRMPGSFYMEYVEVPTRPRGLAEQDD